MHPDTLLAYKMNGGDLRPRVVSAKRLFRGVEQLLQFGWAI